MKLKEKEKDLIEAIRNFRQSLGRMEKQNEFEFYIQKLLAELMYD